METIQTFREQLESYEMEKDALLTQKKEAQGQVQKLADRYTNLLGHQNHKQKIHHLVRLKQENLGKKSDFLLKNENAKKKKYPPILEIKLLSLGFFTDMREEIAKLTLELNKSKKLVNRMKESRSDKENR